MLRITEKKEGAKTKVLFLEGKICQEYRRELQAEIEKGIGNREKIILDLSKVSFLDEEAAKMIKEFADKKLSLRNCSLYIRTVLRLEGKEKK
jgi:anti-anti-sigma regulatory factor